MSKLLSILLFSFFSMTCLAQTWQDHLAEARKLYKGQNFKEALNKYQKAKALAPKDVDFSNELAQALYRTSNFKEADKAFNQNRNKNLKSGTWHNIGNSKMQQQDYQAAIDAYKKALKSDPNAHDTRYNLAQALRKQKQKNQSQDKKNQDQKRQDNKSQDKRSQDKKSQEDERKDESGKESQLAKNNTERLLDELTKKEVETKKKLNSQKVQGTSSNSGKDW